MSNKSNVMKQYDKEKTLYQNFCDAVVYLLKSLLYNATIEYNAITYRIKERESLSRKIDAKGDKYKALSDLTDIAGIRIITYYADDVDRISRIVEREFDIDKENSIDKRKSLEPDRFGYCSVHYVVGIHSKRLNLEEYSAYKNLKCEIQIRSVLQHAWAEIEHDLGYKSSIVVPRDIRRDFSRLAGLLELADKEFDDIRRKLSTYKIEVEDKITDKKFINNDIDAVLLETLITSNDDVIAINKEIESYFGKEFELQMEADDYERTIKKFHWLGISTLGELLNVISANKELAINIAKEKIKMKKKSYNDSIIQRTIAFFYLCYAELFRRYDDKDMFVKYLEENNIGSHKEARANTAMELLTIKEKLLNS